MDNPPPPRDILVEYIKVIQESQKLHQYMVTQGARLNDNLSAIIETYLIMGDIRTNDSPNRALFPSSATADPPLHQSLHPSYLRRRANAIVSMSPAPRRRVQFSPHSSLLATTTRARSQRSEAEEGVETQVESVPERPQPPSNETASQTEIPVTASEDLTRNSRELGLVTSQISAVRVRPSWRQIRDGTQQRVFRDITNPSQFICPIDRGPLEPDDHVLQIIHCRHIFRESSLRRHFRGSPRCPLCRYDIRDYQASDTQTESSTHPHV